MKKTKIKILFIIKDWAGNDCFNRREFKSFDDAEQFLCDFLNDKYEEYREEYEITELIK